MTCRLEEVRPKLRLHRQEHARTDAPQYMCRHEGQIQREIDDGICILDDAICHLVAARRHHGDENRAMGEFLAKLLDQRARGHDLAHGGRMHPDAFLFLHAIEGMLGEKAQALFDALYEALLAHGAHAEYGNDQESDDNRRNIID